MSSIQEIQSMMPFLRLFSSFDNHSISSLYSKVNPYMLPSKTDHVLPDDICMVCVGRRVVTFGIRSHLFITLLNYLRS